MKCHCSAVRLWWKVGCRSFVKLQMSEVLQCFSHLTLYRNETVVLYLSFSAFNFVQRLQVHLFQWLDILNKIPLKSTGKFSNFTFTKSFILVSWFNGLTSQKWVSRTCSWEFWELWKPTVGLLHQASLSVWLSSVPCVKALLNLSPGASTRAMVLLSLQSWTLAHSFLDQGELFA